MLAVFYLILDQCKHLSFPTLVLNLGHVSVVEGKLIGSFWSGTLWILRE